MRQKLIQLQGEIDESTIMTEALNAPLLVTADSIGRKSVRMVELNSIIIQLDVIETYIILHPTTAEYTFFPSLHGTFTRIDHAWAIKLMLTNLKEQKS